MPEHEFESVARAALLEITPASTVGELLDAMDEGDGAVSLQFGNRMPGYPGWRWTVSVTRVDGAAPTVLEVELLPGEGSLLAPDWVPWSERLADYKAAQEAAATAEADDEDVDVDVDDADGDDDDDPDDDLLGSDVLHGGDLDGVDIDDLGDEAVDDDPDDEDLDDAEHDPDDEVDRSY